MERNECERDNARMIDDGPGIHQQVFRSPVFSGFITTMFWSLWFYNTRIDG